MAVTTETIESYFQDYGWQHERLDDAHMLTGFRSETGEIFSIYVTLAPSWVYFSIAPFVPAPTNPECERKLYRHLLRLCQQMNLAKFAVDADGDVTLSVEMPRENLDYSEFSDSLGALSFYADQNYEAVRALATDPDAMSGFEEESDLDWGE